jgi:AcrR family transcriptional regulator
MSPATAPAPSLSKRKRDFVRTQASAAVLALVLERGYDEVTAEDMAAAAGLARRTFFRYFDSKEDALFVAVDAIGTRLADAIRQQPQHQPLWDAVRDGVLAAVKDSPDSPNSKQLTRLLYESPALRARHLDKQERWRRLLANQIEPRLGGPKARYRAGLLAAIAMAALDSAMMEWCRSRVGLAANVAQAFEDARPAAAT